MSDRGPQLASRFWKVFCFLLVTTVSHCWAYSLIWIDPASNLNSKAILNTENVTENVLVMFSAGSFHQVPRMFEDNVL